MGRLKYQMYLDHHCRNVRGIQAKFTDGKGRDTETWWTSPPDSLDHVDISYIQGRFNNAQSKRHEDFIKEQHKLEMKNFALDQKSGRYIDLREVKKKPKVMVFLEGGVVQEVLSDEEIEILIVDRDVQDISEEECVTIAGNEAYVYSENGWSQDKELVEKLFTEYRSQADN